MRVGWGAPQCKHLGMAARGKVKLMMMHDFAKNPVCGVPIVNAATLYEAILQRKIHFIVHSEANIKGEARAQIFP